MAATGRADLDFPGSLQEGGGWRPLRRLLVPVDQFGHSSRALDAALSICDQSGGELRLVHIRTWDAGGRFGGRFFVETSVEATTTLAGQLDLAWRQGARASGAVIEGPRNSIGSIISAQGRGWDADAIVLARRRRNPVGVLLLGSVTDQVLRSASCPVVIVHQERT